MAEFISFRLFDRRDGPVGKNARFVPKKGIARK
jgi:hypothetical protein